MATKITNEYSQAVFNLPWLAYSSPQCHYHQQRLERHGHPEKRLRAYRLLVLLFEELLPRVWEVLHYRYTSANATIETNCRSRSTCFWRLPKVECNSRIGPGSPGICPGLTQTGPGARRDGHRMLPEHRSLGASCPRSLLRWTHPPFRSARGSWSDWLRRWWGSYLRSVGLTQKIYLAGPSHDGRKHIRPGIPNRRCNAVRYS